jgi:hypothetical protein
MSDRTITPDTIRDKIECCIDFSIVNYNISHVIKSNFSHMKNHLIHIQKYFCDFNIKNVVSRFCINDIFNIDDNDVKEKYIDLIKKEEKNIRDIYENIDLQKLSDIEYWNFQNFLSYISNFPNATSFCENKKKINCIYYPLNSCVVDILVKESMSLHSVVFWKYDNNAIIIIDPNNTQRTKYLANLLNNIFTNYKFIIGNIQPKQLYKTKNPKFLCKKNDIPRSGRTCDDVAVKICFILNELHLEFHDSEKIFTEMIKISSNQSKINGMPPKMDCHNYREHLASDKITRNYFHKLIEDNKIEIANISNDDLNNNPLSFIEKSCISKKI